MIPLLLLIILTLFYTLSTLHTYLKNRRISRLHHCQPGLTIFDPFGIRRLLLFIHHARTLRGPLLGQYLSRRYNRTTLPMNLPNAPGIITSDPLNLLHVHTSKSFGVGTSRNALHYLLGPGIFTQEAAAWQHSRSMLRPVFSRCDEILVEIVTPLTNALLARVLREGELDIHPVFTDFMLDCTTRFMLGEGTNALGGGEKNFKGAWKEASWGMLVELYASGAWHWLWRPAGYRRAREAVHSAIDTKIDLGRKRKEGEGEGRYSFLRELLKTEEVDVVRSQVLNVLTAGTDTTAALLSRIVGVMTRDVRVQTALREEVRATFDAQEDLTWAKLEKMRYLRAVVNECLRLYPPAPATSRAALTTTYLPLGGGPDGSAPLLVPEGYRVFLDYYTLHRREDLWGDDAAEFKPERWMNGRKVEEGQFLPFGTVGRQCIGCEFIPEV